MNKIPISRKFAKYFVQGLLFLLPLSITIWAVYYLYNKVTVNIVEHLPNMGAGWKALAISGTLIGVILIIAVLGFFFSQVFAQPLFRIIESLFEHTPFVKLIYGSIKDMMEAFVGDKKRFNRPVLVTMSRDPLVQRPGFITGDNLEALGLREKVAVYIPFSYSVSGQLLIVYRTEITHLDGVNSGEMMKFIVSGGVTGFDESHSTPYDEVQSDLGEEKGI